MDSASLLHKGCVPTAENKQESNCDNLQGPIGDIRKRKKTLSKCVSLYGEVPFLVKDARMQKSSLTLYLSFLQCLASTCINNSATRSKENSQE